LLSDCQIDESFLTFLRARNIDLNEVKTVGDEILLAIDYELYKFLFQTNETRIVDPILIRQVEEIAESVKDCYAKNHNISLDKVSFQVSAKDGDISVTIV
jgi:hypothetical protein